MFGRGIGVGGIPVGRVLCDLEKVIIAETSKSPTVAPIITRETSDQTSEGTWQRKRHCPPEVAAGTFMATLFEAE
jgi:hypothetical protein